MKAKIATLMISALMMITLVSIFQVGIASANPDVINVPDDYATIQEAINNAESGDTIEVAAGSYDEQLVINMSLTLRGAGDATVIQPSGADNLTTVKTTPWIGSGTKQMAAIVFVDTGGSVTVKDLKIDGSKITEVPAGVGGDWVADIAYLETGGTIEGLTVVGNPNLGCRTAGIWASAVSESVLVEVTGCTVEGYNRAGIYALGETMMADYNYNEINGAGALIAQVPNGMFFLEGATGSATYNTVTDLGYIGVGEYRSTGIGTYNAGVDIVFSHNEISFVQNAFALSTGTIGTTVEYNDIHDCHTGIRIEAGAINSTIQYNDIYNNDFAIRCGATMGNGNEAHYNNFTNNSGIEWTNEDETPPNTYVGAVSNVHPTYTLDATYNWWGTTDGSEIFGIVSAGIDFTLWIDAPYPEGMTTEERLQEKVAQKNDEIAEQNQTISELTQERNELSQLRSTDASRISRLQDDKKELEGDLNYWMSLSMTYPAPTGGIGEDGGQMVFAVALGAVGISAMLCVKAFTNGGKKSKG